jgi:hypothetical protein
MLVQREVFEKFDSWFDPPPYDVEKDWMLEDWDFCWRARQFEYQIILHPGVRPGHIKQITVSVGTQTLT